MEMTDITVLNLTFAHGAVACAAKLSSVYKSLFYFQSLLNSFDKFKKAVALKISYDLVQSFHETCQRYLSRRRNPK